MNDMCVCLCPCSGGFPAVFISSSFALPTRSLLLFPPIAVVGGRRSATAWLSLYPLPNVALHEMVCV